MGRAYPPRRLTEAIMVGVTLVAKALLLCVVLLTGFWVVGWT